ncbi:glucoamylase family protein [Roseivirga pacifica]|uniref:glucoamylase family protein n=1 Tax=Roseivirga pacifica TaxID=1267423 RepID=UPI00209633DC|nr:glucoamylase family protein [Roseivirga pacifica]MCO6360350.1 beta-glucosidase [Roseivirga pacifica]MCO6368239.1 beta-glucosidase [Roseivirga pacifica]MCO6372381.1 beta-glucosidase [Roseivirga pacifica]MCO6376439.1 beta-glucosidase [Roseivirga pacifica]MCO6378281.1 beta-glucosidase [Roseivirga pacifica]
MNKKTVLQSLLALAFCLAINACSQSKGANEQTGADSQSEEDSLLNLVQYQTFQYFWDGAEPNSGLARERFHTDNIYPSHDKDIITSGGSGFGLMAIIVGIERGFITHEEGIERFEKIVDFLETADTFHGVFPHWWDGHTGKAKAFSQKDDGGDLVETSFMAAGLLTVRQYLDKNDEREAKLAERINTIWKNIDFNWYTKGENVLYWHWSPNYGWEMNFDVRGYNECLIMYVLAASSPTHPVKPEVYHEGWAMNGEIANDTIYYGLETELNHYETNDSPVGPLFWAHYSYLGLNPKGLKDKYADYWKLNQNHAKIHYRHAVANPNEFEGYGEDMWGFTSSYSMRGYAGHRPDRDLGVISPTAALSSFPYTPDESMAMLKKLYNETDSLVGVYGPYDAFSFQDDWYLPRYLAIDQGPIPVMIENYRSELIWDLFMSAPEVKVGLDKLGFTYE